MGNIAQLSITMTAGSANAIALSQTPGAAGNLTINGALASGGVATLDIARRVAITSTSNISNRTFTITGTCRNGYTQTETITGPNNSTVYTTKDFKTITQSAISGSAAGALTVGTNGVASTAWYCGDYLNGKPITLTVALSTGAVLTYTVEYTQTNLNDNSLQPYSEAITQAQNAVVFPSTDSAVVNASSNQASNFLQAQPGMRLTLNSYTSGTATITFVPANVHTF